jgi:predicted homoserine dehydrogenase-like protein
MVDVRIGIAGTGFIARNLAREISRRDGYRVESVLTRRPPGEVDGFDTGVVGNSLEQALSGIDVLVECSGDAIRATDVIAAAVERGLPVVTMNTEFHITTGSSFVGQGLVTEAAGDQPGCLAELHEEAVAMGFKPTAYGNMKGFLNENPSRKDMEYWGGKQGISLSMVTSFTDGTKVQAEQILVGNHFGARLSQEIMLWTPVEDQAEASAVLAAAADEAGGPIADFVVSRNLPHGVFIVATHDEAQAPALEYYKLGPGPHYTLIRNNIFVHLEILKTIDRVLRTGEALLHNSRKPTMSLAAIAKRDLQPGERIDEAIGSFELRGSAVRITDRPDLVPIGLIQAATITAPVAEGEHLSFDHVDLPETAALEHWFTIRASVIDSDGN